MKDNFEMPGLQFVGTICEKRVNDGAPIPLFEPKEPTDRPSINTLEGWCRLVAESKARHVEEDAAKASKADGEQQNSA